MSKIEITVEPVKDTTAVKEAYAEKLVELAAEKAKAEQEK